MCARLLANPSMIEKFWTNPKGRTYPNDIVTTMSPSLQSGSTKIMCPKNPRERGFWKLCKTAKNAGNKHFPPFQHYFNPFPNKPGFSHVCRTSLLKTLWEKQKLLLSSISPFPPVRRTVRRTNC